MQLRQLEYFLAIWDAGSFSGAAAQLYVTQPSLSQQLAALERGLGAALFERGRHGVTLTPAGRVLLPQAQAILRAVADARDSVRDVIEARAGDVHVLTVRSVASGILPTPAARWHSLVPAVVLRVSDYSHRRELEHALRGGLGDLAIGPRPQRWEGPVGSLGFEEMVVSTPAADQSAPAADPAEMANAEWVLYEPEQGMSEVVDQIAAHFGFTPKAVARTGQVTAALQFAIEGIGMAVTPENAVPLHWSRHTRRIAAGVFREIVVYSRSTPTGLARRYWDMITSVELPLTAERDLPEAALRL